MKNSADRILTTHVGSLARPARQLELLFARERGEDFDREEFEVSTLFRHVTPRIHRSRQSKVICVLRFVSTLAYPTFLAPQILE